MMPTSTHLQGMQGMHMPNVPWVHGPWSGMQGMGTQYPHAQIFYLPHFSPGDLAGVCTHSCSMLPSNGCNFVQHAQQLFSVALATRFRQQNICPHSAASLSQRHKCQVRRESSNGILSVLCWHRACALLMLTLVWSSVEYVLWLYVHVST